MSLLGYRLPGRCQVFGVCAPRARAREGGADRRAADLPPRGGQVSGAESAPGRAPAGAPGTAEPPPTAPAGPPGAAGSEGAAGPGRSRRVRVLRAATRCCSRTAATMITPRATACAELDRLFSVKTL